MFDGEKCVLLLCAWKPAFHRFGHISYGTTVGLILCAISCICMLFLGMVVSSVHFNWPTGDTVLIPKT